MINRNFHIKVFFLFLLSIANLSTCLSQKLYKVSKKQFGTIIGSSFVMGGTGYLFENNRAPISAQNFKGLDPQSIPRFDRSTIGNYSEKASKQSDYFKHGIWAAPLTLFSSREGRKNALEIGAMYSEVISLNRGLTAMTKGIAGRYRPYTYNSNFDLDKQPIETTRRSFFSGHVSHVASLSFFTATVFDDLYPDSDYKYLVWAGAVSAPAITAYLRVVSGNHFPTDVIVGYSVGALVGVLIPRLHKMSTTSNLEIKGAQNGLGLVYTF